MKASFSYPAVSIPGFSLFQVRSRLLILSAVIVAVLFASVLWVAPIQLLVSTGFSSLGFTSQSLPASYYQAMQLRQTGDLVAALQQLEQAAIASPAVPVLYELGRAEFQLSQIEDAIAHYRAALAQDPDHAPSAYELGGILVTLGNLEEGIALLQHSVEVSPTVLGHYDLGIALGRQGDRNAEVTSLNQAIALEPNHADAHLNLGLSYAYLGEIPFAKQHLKQARDLYQAQIEALEHAHLGRNSLDAQIIDQMMISLDSGCGVQCWQVD